MAHLFTPFETNQLGERVIKCLTQGLLPNETEARAGRPQAATKQDVLKAIHDYKTTSASKLAKQLSVARATVYRRLQEINANEISQALGIIREAELKPAQMQYAVFQRTPEINDFYDALRYKRDNSEKYSNDMARAIFRICLHLNRKPSALTPESAAELVLKIKKKEVISLGIHETRKAVRAWFTFKGVSAQKLTNLGIDARPRRVGEDRSMARLTRTQRALFMAVLREAVRENWVSRDGRYRLCFRENSVLASAVLALPYFLYYTGTRIRATLAVKWGKSVKIESDAVTFRVVDKGRHGGITWFKRLIGEPHDAFVAFYEKLGCPEQGNVFPLPYEATRRFFIECYQKAGISEWLWRGMPFHVWRHTAAQDMLEATDWNYGLVAGTLGWESVETLKQHYGRMPCSSQVRGLMKAMGLPIKEEKKEFVF
jgi:integrase